MGMDTGTDMLARKVVRPDILYYRQVEDSKVRIPVVLDNRVVEVPDKRVPAHNTA